MSNIIRTILLTFYFHVILTTPLDDPDVGLNTNQLIENHGYTSETHTITTQDGYILAYQRIINGNSTSSKPGILLMHGAALSSADWVNMGTERSLGFLLADLGYDVWLGNARGTPWSRNHTTLDPTENAAEFFNFSWHEIGYYDLAAAIDYILETSGNDKVYYVGHSYGTAAFLALASTRPEYNDKIKMAALLAPVSFMENTDNVALLIVAQYIYQLEAIANTFGIYEIPFVKEIGTFAVQFCSQPEFVAICEDILFHIVGEDKLQFDEGKVAVIFSNAPSNCALREFYHSGQLVKNGGFLHYDYGTEENLEIYGTVTPPAYNLSQISAPIGLYYGSNDIVVNVKDAAELANQLPNLVKDYLISYKLFNHFDFLYAKDVKEFLYEELIKDLQAH